MLWHRWQWVYTYTINPPTFTLPANGSATVACISDAQVVPTPPVVTNSCGGNVVPTGPVIGTDPVCSGTKTYTWTYTDCTGASLDWTFTYTISPPTFTLPANGGSTVACVNDAQVVPTPPAVTDNCGASITPTGPTISPDPTCGGTKTYTWTYTDCSGTANQWVYTYTISPSTFTLPPDDGSTVTCIGDAQVVPTPPAVNDNCGNPVTPTGPVIGPDPVCSGTKTYTWTYTDCSGNNLQWVYTYTITPSTFTLPPDDGSTVPCIADAQVIPTPPPANNSCGDPLTITGPVVGADPACGGTKTYSWTYTDCVGGTQTWTYTYTINNPTFTLPANGGTTVACISDAQTVPTPPAVNNSCGTPLNISAPVISPDPVCSGTKTYTFTYTDCTGATQNWVFTYTISPPTFTLPANSGSTVACVSDAQVVPTPPVVSNSCGGAVNATGPVVSPDPVCSGTKTYTWTYTDCTGSSIDWIYTYTISPPSLAVPADGGSNVNCVSDAQVVPTPPVVNNSCGGAVVPTGPVIGPDPVCSGTKTYTWTYTDCTGASEDWVYIYTVSPPSLALPPDDGSTVACVSDAQTVPTPPSVNDSCGNPITPTGPVVSADPACSGTKTYVWTYTDCAGNTGDWTYTYTITGDTGPIFNAPPTDVTVACVADIPAMIDLTYTNSCSGGGTVTGSDSPITGSCPATVVRTWTVTDACGNAATVTQDIIINDTTPPTASDPAPVNVAACNGPVPAPDPNVVNDEADNCGVPVVAFVSDNTTLNGCTETTIRTYSVTDACNNSITVEQTITRTFDMTPPVFNPVPTDITVNCLGEVPPMQDLNYTDNCSPSGTVTGTETGPSGNPLTIIRMWSITDACGNQASVTQTITINSVLVTIPITEEICPGDMVTINGEDYSIPGMYTDTIPGMNGDCDTILNITINGLPYNTSAITEDLCPGETVTINGMVYSTGGTFTDTLQGNGGECDTILTITINEHPYNTNTISASICPGETITIYGMVYDMGGTYSDTVTNVTGGCDTLVTINIAELSLVPSTVNASFCTGESVVVYGNTYSTAGTFQDTVQSTTGGCDTAVTIIIAENPLIQANFTHAGCEGDGYSIVINGTTYDESNPSGTEQIPGCWNLRYYSPCQLNFCT